MPDTASDLLAGLRGRVRQAAEELLQQDWLTPLGERATYMFLNSQRRQAGWMGMDHHCYAGAPDEECRAVRDVLQEGLPTLEEDTALLILREIGSFLEMEKRDRPGAAPA